MPQPDAPDAPQIFEFDDALIGGGAPETTEPFKFKMFEFDDAPAGPEEAKPEESAVEPEEASAEEAAAGPEEAAAEEAAAGPEEAKAEESAVEPEEAAAEEVAAGPEEAKAEESAVEPEEAAAEEAAAGPEEAKPEAEEPAEAADGAAAEETAKPPKRRKFAVLPKLRQKQPKRQRSARGRKKKKIGIAGTIVRVFFAAVAVCILIGGYYCYNYFYGFVKDMPVHDPTQIEASLKVMSTIYDDEGNEMKDIYLADARRELVTYEQLPRDLIDAMVAVEDKTFWRHKGFNITRIIGALRESYLGGGDISGTSTITQQLARNIWLAETRSEYTLERKVKEAVLARELERNLTKEEILTNYMNTIALGNHSYGVAAAARLYFDKDLSELDLLECAALAALPQSPSKYSMITTAQPGEVTAGNPDILLSTDEYIFLYNEDALPRIRLVLDLMYEQGYLTQGEYTRAINGNIRSRLHPQPLQVGGNSSFFIGWLIDDVAEDLMIAYPDEFSDTDAALQMIYSGGLEIHSTFNQRIQDVVTEEFEDPKNYPLANLARDRNGNAVDNGAIILFDYNNMFVNFESAEGDDVAEDTGEDTGEDAEASKEDAAGIGDPWFFLNEEDFEMLPNGGMRIFAGVDKRLGIYKTSGDWGEDISVEFKDFFTKPPGTFYIVKGGIVNIPSEYKSTDAQGNLILSPALFTGTDNIFLFEPFEDGGIAENGAAGNYWIGPDHFKLAQPVVQPQGATAVLEHHTGQVKAMVGGRGIEGQMQYNRALSPRQPGSTMKPLGTYGAALEKTAEGIPVSYPEESFGEWWTAASVIEDEALEYGGRVWPKNWYGGYRGPQTMRKSIEQSINVNAVRVQLAVGNKRSVDFLKKLGITTVVETGDINDLNPAALALGGMTLGLKPLESASAYGTFANAGIHVDPIGYTKVMFRDGSVLLDGTPRETQAMDPGAAFIMNDMLRTAISQGIASRASVKGVPVAGKTGTTSENLDAWFVGNTPKYSAAVWLGNDVSIQMSQGSAAAAYLFSKMMARICEGEEPGEYPEMPANVEKGSVEGISDYFIIGTKPESLMYGDLICIDSGYLATPLCTNTERRRVRPLNGSTAGMTDEEIAAMAAGAPVWYCPLHNDDPGEYPVDPAPPPPPSSSSWSEPAPPPLPPQEPEPEPDQELAPPIPPLIPNPPDGIVGGDGIGDGGGADGG
ncbi:MAG: transglycosylase domain-containing protein [Clostridiales Family XIII bacterium]|nr:transglycosylase domain-containing protein [Clostridiales Family XIII bacterium]